MTSAKPEWKRSEAMNPNRDPLPCAGKKAMLSNNDLCGPWRVLKCQAARAAAREPALAELLRRAVLQNRSFAAGLAHLLAGRLAANQFDVGELHKSIAAALESDNCLAAAAEADLWAAVEQDPARPLSLHVFLFYKGFLALQAYRVAHWLWREERRTLALFLQNRMSEVFGVDIHPAADIGKSIVLDHATGLVIGETAVVGDRVSLFHEVTLGGTGKEAGDRHPKVREDVLIGAGARVLGNVEIGRGARIGAGSVVLENIPPFATAVGIPARVVALHRKPLQPLHQPGDSEGSSPLFQLLPVREPALARYPLARA
jgi:serine O-acetyltransferase